MVYVRREPSMPSRGVPVLVPVRASPVPSVVRGTLVVKFFCLGGSGGVPVIVLARASSHLCRACLLKEIKKTDNPREGWEDGTPPPHTSEHLYVIAETGCELARASTITGTQASHTRGGRGGPAVLHLIWRGVERL